MLPIRIQTGAGMGPAHTCFPPLPLGFSSCIRQHPLRHNQSDSVLHKDAKRANNFQEFNQIRHGTHYTVLDSVQFCFIPTWPVN